MLRATGSESGRSRVVVVGAGGNIGSHLVPHIGRQREVTHVTLIDPDRYEASNLASQDIDMRDVGRPKVAVQARRLRRIRPELAVHAIPEDVATVPLGYVRGDVILACLDSRRARQYVNEAAWRLDVPWIDAGVQGDGLLARVGAYVPGTEAPCLECAWDDRDYEVLEQQYPCQPTSATSPAHPTHAASSLGALAAATQALELQKLLAGHWECALVGRQLVVDAAHHKYYVTKLRRNPRCRFDHATWRIEPIKSHDMHFRLRGLLDLGRECVTADDGAILSVGVGRRFVTQLACPSCGGSRRVLRLHDRLTPRRLRCRHCDGAMVPAAFGLADGIHVSADEPRLLGRSLRSLGIRNGDVITLRGPTAEVHYEASAA